MSSTSPSTVAAVILRTAADAYLPTIASLREVDDLTFLFGASEPRFLDPLERYGFDRDKDAAVVSGVGDLVRRAWRHYQHVLLVSQVVVVPPGLLDSALAWSDADRRIATVSFLSNDAGLFGFPVLNHPSPMPPSGHDERSLTRRLRALDPVPGPVPMPHAAGGVVLLTTYALGAVGMPADSPNGEIEASIADFSLHGRRRGFVDVLDATTFVSYPSDLRPPNSSAGEPLDRMWVFDRHPFAREFVSREVQPQAPIGRAVQSARAKVLGLRVLIDGSCLGPHQMGTQVATLALIDSLVHRDDIDEVGVVLAGAIPSYATSILHNEKVQIADMEQGVRDERQRFDVAHRPYQPGHDFDVAAWRTVADRVVVTILDLIAYHVGAYHSSEEDWRVYRETIERVVNHVDAISVISSDVADQVRLHQFPIDTERLFVNHLGTEHLTGGEAVAHPSELLERGFHSEQFLLCLGTNYTHKNRDLAIRAHDVLRARGYNLSLIMAGAAVPHGSSRLLEVGLGPFDESVIFLPDVTAPERNWLLKHAAVVLYPTSAEGFGFVPYEAARFGTPTVNVGFGPLREVAGEVPVVADDWRPETIADATEQLLNDPAHAREQIAILHASGDCYTWSATAASIASMYRAILALPPRMTGTA